MLHPPTAAQTGGESGGLVMDIPTGERTAAAGHSGPAVEGHEVRLASLAGSQSHCMFVVYLQSAA